MFMYMLLEKYNNSAYCGLFLFLIYRAYLQLAEEAKLFASHFYKIQSQQPESTYRTSEPTQTSDDNRD